MPLSSGCSYDMENHQFGTHFPLLGVYCMSAHALCCVAALLFGSLMQLRLSG